MEGTRAYMLIFPTASLFLVVSILSGCASTVQYVVREVPVVSNSPLSSYRLVVREFRDVRAVDLKAISRYATTLGGHVIERGGKEFFYNVEVRYREGGVARWLTKNLAKQIGVSGLFRRVDMIKDKTTSADFVLEGEVEQFEAIKDTEGAVAANLDIGGAAAYGAGLVMGLLADKAYKDAIAKRESRYEAVAKLSNLKLLKVDTQQVVWEGDVEARVAGFDPPGPLPTYEEANRALRRAVEELIEKLSQVDLSTVRAPG